MPPLGLPAQATRLPMILFPLQLQAQGVFFLRAYSFFRSFLQAQGDAIRNSPDRQILGAQQLAVGPTGRQGRRAGDRARNPPNCF